VQIGEGCHEQQVFVADSKDAEKVAKTLGEGLGREVQVAHWHEFNPQLRRTMRVTISQTAVITFIVMVVILFGIGSTISMTAAERIREFGLLGVLGFGPRSIGAYVIVEALVVGLSTMVAAGIVVTLVILGMGVNGIDLTPIAGERIVLDGVLIDMHMKPTPNPGDYAWSALLVIGTSLLAALMPAFRASRLRPAQALRTTV
jgi:putative ABC transport system permease protein